MKNKDNLPINCTKEEIITDKMKGGKFWDNLEKLKNKGKNG